MVGVREAVRLRARRSEYGPLLQRENGLRGPGERQQRAAPVVLLAPCAPRHDVERQGADVDRRVHHTDALLLPGGAGPLGQTGDRGGQGGQDAEADQAACGRPRLLPADQVEHGGGGPEPDRQVGQRRVHGVPGRDAAQQVAAYRVGDERGPPRPQPVDQVVEVAVGLQRADQVDQRVRRTGAVCRAPLAGTVAERGIHPAWFPNLAAANLSATCRGA